MLCSDDALISILILQGVHRNGEEQAINRSPCVYYFYPILFRVLCVDTSV